MGKDVQICDSADSPQLSATFCGETRRVVGRRGLISRLYSDLTRDLWTVSFFICFVGTVAVPGVTGADSNGECFGLVSLFSVVLRTSRGRGNIGCFGGLATFMVFTGVFVVWGPDPGPVTVPVPPFLGGTRVRGRGGTVAD